ncbi:uncharacterized protein LOC108681741 [Hyalella azteca]|uniref:Uncharacterized protein LOC108681741 n=1 Tax=Hyalella azteca TaxID=294128 RepID=A0A8B7PJF6_HYAAZ|nr:uncharacterized protein LOC108681741 [Hyalella azteca]XP_047738480.1 uncharacterized protein LOC108681741 [Hyalella azteca]XP_047738481.1 uncharacterized protein LOC108681741 [Hyalella azteca]XP_047738482.1 uncharacterized protein LOC108681741 [Hyalella azteca]
MSPSSRSSPQRPGTPRDHNSVHGRRSNSESDSCSVASLPLDYLLYNQRPAEKTPFCRTSDYSEVRDFRRSFQTFSGEKTKNLEFLITADSKLNFDSSLESGPYTEPCDFDLERHQEENEEVSAAKSDSGDIERGALSHLRGTQELNKISSEDKTSIIARNSLTEISCSLSSGVRSPEVIGYQLDATNFNPDLSLVIEVCRDPGKRRKLIKCSYAAPDNEDWDLPDVVESCDVKRKQKDVSDVETMQHQACFSEHPANTELAHQDKIEDDELLSRFTNHQIRTIVSGKLNRIFQSKNIQAGGTSKRLQDFRDESTIIDCYNITNSNKSKASFRNSSSCGRDAIFTGIVNLAYEDTMMEGTRDGQETRSEQTEARGDEGGHAIQGFSTRCLPLILSLVIAWFCVGAVSNSLLLINAPLPYECSSLQPAPKIAYPGSYRISSFAVPLRNNFSCIIPNSDKSVVNNSSKASETSFSYEEMLVSDAFPLQAPNFPQHSSLNSMDFEEAGIVESKKIEKPKDEILVLRIGSFEVLVDDLAEKPDVSHFEGGQHTNVQNIAGNEPFFTAPYEAIEEQGYFPPYSQESLRQAAYEANETLTLFEAETEKNHVTSVNVTNYIETDSMNSHYSSSILNSAQQEIFPQTFENVKNNVNFSSPSSSVASASFFDNSSELTFGQNYPAQENRQYIELPDKDYASQTPIANTTTYHDIDRMAGVDKFFVVQNKNSVEIGTPGHIWRKTDFDPCPNVSYDMRAFRETLVSHYDVVCGRSWLRQLIQSLQAAAGALGGLAGTALADRVERLLGAQLCAALHVVCSCVCLWVAPSVLWWLLAWTVLNAALSSLSFILLIMAADALPVDMVAPVSLATLLPHGLGTITAGLAGDHYRHWQPLLLIATSPAFLLLPLSLLVLAQPLPPAKRSKQLSGAANQLNARLEMSPTSASEKSAGSSTTQCWQLLLLLLLWLLHGCAAAFLQPHLVLRLPDSPFLLLVALGALAILASVTALAFTSFKMRYRHAVLSSLSAILSLACLVMNFIAVDRHGDVVLLCFLATATIFSMASLLSLQVHAVLTPCGRWRCVLVSSCYVAATLGRVIFLLVDAYARVGAWFPAAAAAAMQSVACALSFFLPVNTSKF